MGRGKIERMKELAETELREFFLEEERIRLTASSQDEKFLEMVGKGMIMKGITKDYDRAF